jgi:hypothetical protein
MIREDGAESPNGAANMEGVELADANNLERRSSQWGFPIFGRSRGNDEH